MATPYKIDHHQTLGEKPTQSFYNQTGSFTQLNCPMVLSNYSLAEENFQQQRVRKVKLRISNSYNCDSDQILSSTRQWGDSKSTE